MLNAFPDYLIGSTIQRLDDNPPIRLLDDREIESLGYGSCCFRGAYLEGAAQFRQGLPISICNGLFVRHKWTWKPMVSQPSSQSNLVYRVAVSLGCIPIF